MSEICCYAISTPSDDFKDAMEPIAQMKQLSHYFAVVGPGDSPEIAREAPLSITDITAIPVGQPLPENFRLVDDLLKSEPSIFNTTSGIFSSVESAFQLAYQCSISKSPIISVKLIKEKEVCPVGFEVLPTSLFGRFKLCTSNSVAPPSEAVPPFIRLSTVSQRDFERISTTYNVQPTIFGHVIRSGPYSGVSILTSANVTASIPLREPLFLCVHSHPLAIDSSSSVFRPKLLHRLPERDHRGLTLSTDTLSTFCFPDGVRFSPSALPAIHGSFVQTQADGCRLYFSTLTVWKQESVVVPRLGPLNTIIHELQSCHIPVCLVLASTSQMFNAMLSCLKQIAQTSFLSCLSSSSCSCLPTRCARALVARIFSTPLPPSPSIPVALDLSEHLSLVMRSSLWVPTVDVRVRFLCCLCPYFQCSQFPMTSLFQALPIPLLIRLWVSALLEHRICIVSRRPFLLCPLFESLQSLLHPLQYPFIYIPSLPRLSASPASHSDSFSAPVLLAHSPSPLLIGCHPCHFDHIINFDLCETFSSTDESSIPISFPPNTSVFDCDNSSLWCSDSNGRFQLMMAPKHYSSVSNAPLSTSSSAPKSDANFLDSFMHLPHFETLTASLVDVANFHFLLPFASDDAELLRNFTSPLPVIGSQSDSHHFNPPSPTVATDSKHAKSPTRSKSIEKSQISFPARTFSLSHARMQFLMCLASWFAPCLEILIDVASAPSKLESGHTDDDALIKSLCEVIINRSEHKVIRLPDFSS